MVKTAAERVGCYDGCYLPKSPLSLPVSQFHTLIERLNWEMVETVELYVDSRFCYRQKCDNGRPWEGGRGDTLCARAVYLFSVTIVIPKE